jgi:hypothetical protein
MRSISKYRIDRDFIYMHEKCDEDALQLATIQRTVVLRQTAE